MREQSVNAEREQPVHFQSDGLRLEGALRPRPDPRLAAVVLHPHPLYGGDMDNHVVTSLCAALNMLGGTTLRFNFRGTGRSEGEHDNGLGEQDDLRAAIAFIEERYPGVEVWLAGFSFGSSVMLRAPWTRSRVTASASRSARPKLWPAHSRRAIFRCTPRRTAGSRAVHA